MGKMVDDSDRKQIITYSLIVQNSCVSICAVILWFILPFGAPHPPLQNWKFDLFFFGLVLVRYHSLAPLACPSLMSEPLRMEPYIRQIGSFASLASMVGDIAVGRDWVVVITDGHNDELTRTIKKLLKDSSHRLLTFSCATEANAMVTRISLFCKVAAPVMFSLVMAFTSTSTLPLLFCCLMTAS